MPHSQDRATQLTHSPGLEIDTVISQDGTFLAYVSGNPNFLFGNIIGNIAPSSIWVVPLSGGEPVQIREDKHMNMSPVWESDGKHILFISDQDGNRDVYPRFPQPAFSFNENFFQLFSLNSD